ncbi:hypothetical protein AQJ67_42430 [Streptomyces caeruleatus]|uniref:Uncharacterized protein n=1 Tax=Streptomyces caeruleatus TaxID=661399 RepID=A0A117RHR0_9ACTN|nr:hypothetical protein AQJ67_42430 [Streptomyces caeruleatus]
MMLSVLGSAHPWCRQWQTSEKWSPKSSVRSRTPELADMARAGAAISTVDQTSGEKAEAELPSSRAQDDSCQFLL